MAPTPFEFSEIQGLIASGYARQRAMCCLHLKITNKETARNWLNQICSEISFCDDKSSQSKLNIAFTYSGLEQLDSSDDLQHFAREFREGMVTPHRQRVLGDLPESPSDPLAWKWGGPKNDAIHMLLLVYEVDTAAMEDRLAKIHQQLAGVEPVAQLRSAGLKDNKEHFGFRDGIGQPWVQGLHPKTKAARYERDRIEPGELIFGSLDNNGMPESAPPLANNGTFLVLRQIEQRVPEFWSSFNDSSDKKKLHSAAKKMGRWPDGTPLTLSPDKADPELPLNDFEFSKTDADGSKCPFGSHIRRANPRDALVQNPKTSQEEVNRHRILRRGRAYGLAASPEVYPGDVEVRSDEDAIADDETRGLFFICLGANIARQFEFCQQSWLNEPTFLGLSNETDAIASQVQWSGPGTNPVFTAQASPLRCRVSETEKFVHTTGGAYFFMPSRTALLSLGKAIEQNPPAPRCPYH